MIDLGFDFVFLSERADYRVICARGRLPLVFNRARRPLKTKRALKSFKGGNIFYRRVAAFTTDAEKGMKMIQVMYIKNSVIDTKTTTTTAHL
jgi:hypothetical protein